MSRPRLGLALGSGSARGWAHIGILRALDERGLRPDVITGASVGALVGAACAAGRLADLEEWVCKLTQRDVWRLVDTTFPQRRRDDGQSPDGGHCSAHR